MDKIWMTWCRICAYEDVDNFDNRPSTEDTNHLFENISKYLSEKISREDNLPDKVCTPCEQQIASIASFIEHTSKVQAMFSELASKADEINVNEIRFSFLDQHDSKENVLEPLAEQMIDEIKPIVDEFINPILIGGIKEEHNLVEDEGMKDELPEEIDDIKSENSSDTNEHSVDTSEHSIDVSIRQLAPYFCSECSISYTQFHYYRKHMRVKHERTLSPLTCPICKEAQATITKLKRHMAKHIHQERNTCRHCGEQFSKSYPLQRHIRKFHTTVRRYICEQCGKCCKNAITLGEHQLTHKGKAYKCSTCDKKFINKYTLKVHQDTHSDSYMCQICGLQLNTKRTLNMHKLVHSNQKSHKCNYCGKEYKRAKGLKTHLIIHADLKPYKCNFCGKCYRNGSNCRKHIKVSHPGELAAAEANGEKTTTTNIPTLKQLQLVTSKNVDST